ncbi:MAG: TIGR00159 family protein [Clostridiales bacterium]|nr:TIGR00159 family protein [Clostridiales bacterium]
MEQIKEIFASLTAFDVLVIVLAFLLTYAVFAFLKANNARLIVWFYALALSVVSCILLVRELSGVWILLVPAIFILVIAPVFSLEIKRMLWSGKMISRNHEQKIHDKQIERSVNEIIRAVQNMSKQDVGALIILATAPVPNSITESGTVINSDITSQLIESVFFPNTPLHDGAMIIRGITIESAGCFLPLSQELNLPQELGTRHRAGIGITETVDVISIIVSEESGIISMARKGEFKRYLDTESLRSLLVEYYRNMYGKGKESKNDD